MRVLVTGGAGFIGSALVDRLLAEDHTVDVLDDLSTGSLGNLAHARQGHQGQFTFHRLDVRSGDLPELFTRRRPQVVFHLAGTGDGRASLVNPVADAEVNLLGALKVVEAARRCGVTKVVMASSGTAIYGELSGRDLPVRESHPQVPVSPHGVAKKAVFDYLHAYRERHSLEFSVLALANVYGPRRDGRPTAGVVGAFAAALTAGEACRVFGDGEQTRDFVFIDDVVDAFARAVERGGGLLLNIGTGTETSLNDLYAVLAAAAGVDRPPSYQPGRPGDLRRSALDPGRAAIHLGWKPWTDLSTGAASILEALR